MMNWGLSEVEVLACFFVASATLILVGLKMIIGPAPRNIAEHASPVETTFPRLLTAVEDEGFQVVELYDDACALKDWLSGSTQKAVVAHNGAAIRTAKVRDPESGEITLMRVLDRAGRIH